MLKRRTSSSTAAASAGDLPQRQTPTSRQVAVRVAETLVVRAASAISASPGRLARPTQAAQLSAISKPTKQAAPIPPPLPRPPALPSPPGKCTCAAHEHTTQARAKMSAQVLGTIAYMAPECIRGEVPPPRADAHIRTSVHVHARSHARSGACTMARSGR